MLAVPAHYVKLLRLREGQRVKLFVRNGALVVSPLDLPQYTLEELLKDAKPRRRISKEDRQWLDAPRVGRELI